MSIKGTAIGIVITVIVIIGIAHYTNLFELARPTVETSINSTKDTVSKVQGKDVISKAEEITSDIKNVTSQIKIKNPLTPKK